MNKHKLLFICAICGNGENCTKGGVRIHEELSIDEWYGIIDDKKDVVEIECVSFNKFDPLFTVGGCFICGDIGTVKSFRNKCPKNDSVRFFGVCSQHMKDGNSLIEEVERQTQEYMKKYSGKRGRIT